MTNKRYVYVDAYEDTGVGLDGAEEPLTCEECADLLNNLTKENEELKSELNDVGSSIEERVMKVIDNKINELESDLNRSVKAGMPTGSLYGEIELLEDLKKELKE